MIRTIVQRPPGDKPGPDISDELLTTELAAEERGRNEIDANFTNREIVSSSGPYVSYMRQGSIVEVADSEQQTWRGKILSCAINVTVSESSYQRIINLTIEREA